MQGLGGGAGGWFRVLAPKRCVSRSFVCAPGLMRAEDEGCECKEARRTGKVCDAYTLDPKP